jgi:hypothetical protein
VNSVIATTHRTVTAGICTQGYSVLCEGTLNAVDSKFLYVSGEQSKFFFGEGRGSLRNVTIARSDGASLRMAGVNGNKIAISDCKFQTAGKYGVFVLSDTKSPLRIEDSTLLGAAADVFLSKGDADLILVDCAFRKGHVLFQNAEGSVTVKWRVRVEVMKDGRPATDMRVVTKEQGEEISAMTDAKGIAVLEVTEGIIRNDGMEAVTPHVFKVADGENVQAESEKIRVTGPHADIGTVELSID